MKPPCSYSLLPATPATLRPGAEWSSWRVCKKCGQVIKRLEVDGIEVVREHCGPNRGIGAERAALRISLRTQARAAEKLTRAMERVEGGMKKVLREALPEKAKIRTAPHAKTAEILARMEEEVRRMEGGEVAMPTPTLPPPPSHTMREEREPEMLPSPPTDSWEEYISLDPPPAATPPHSPPSLRDPTPDDQDPTDVPGLWPVERLWWWMGGEASELPPQRRRPPTPRQIDKAVHGTPPNDGLEAEASLNAMIAVWKRTEAKGE